MYIPNDQDAYYIQVGTRHTSHRRIGTIPSFFILIVDGTF